MYRHFIRSF